jgi:2-oxoglutarate ferredoxin oxidoreductase subunit beta
MKSEPHIPAPNLGPVNPASPARVPLALEHTVPGPLAPASAVLHAKDLSSDQEVRWCPGCGDFSILAAFKKVLAGCGVPRERIVVVSGLGCSSRMPFYLNTYGFQTIHGRAPTIATGLKLARPDLQVWVVTGDGDGLSAGLAHLVHALRRNVDIKVLLIDNETLGQSRGQFSPTSRPGTRSHTSPLGSVESPLRALGMALAAQATFLARGIDVDVDHLTDVLARAAAHRGSAFVQIYQNCKIFNDGVFEYATDKGDKADTLLYLEHGQPLVWGKDQNRGLALNGLKLEEVDATQQRARVLVHDEQADDPSLACLLGRLAFPDYPECVGVFRAIERPTHHEILASQRAEARQQAGGVPDLEQLLAGEETWDVESAE